jgi:hypothetical protein
MIQFIFLVVFLFNFNCYNIDNYNNLSDNNLYNLLYYNLFLRNPSGSVPSANIFKELPTPPFQGRRGHSLTVLNNKLFFSGGENISDVWATEDGINWDQKNANAFGNADYHQIIAFKGDLYAAVLWNGNRGIWKSSDEGVTWTNISSPSISASNYCLFSYTDKLYMSVRYEGLYRSDDGITWTLLSNNYGYPCTSSSSNLYFINNNNLYQSSDGTITTNISLPLDQYGRVVNPSFAFFYVNNNLYFIGRDSKSILSIYNETNKWQTYSTNINNITNLGGSGGTDVVGILPEKDLIIISLWENLSSGYQNRLFSVKISDLPK